MSVERGSVQLFEHKEETSLSKQIEQVSDGKKWNYNKLIKETGCFPETLELFLNIFTVRL